MAVQVVNTIHTDVDGATIPTTADLMGIKICTNWN
jgi:hypothetical protein